MGTSPVRATIVYDLGPQASLSILGHGHRIQLGMTFSAEAYAQGERFQLERRRLFARTWLPFCAAGQLAAPGDFVSQTVGGWPMVAIRGADGLARGFRNACKHQGMPVVEKPAGRCDVLRCRYHGWTYDLAGALIVAPPPVAPADPSAPFNPLDALALAERDGIVHLRGRGDDAAPLADLAVAGLDFVAAHSLDLDANWKTAIEWQLGDEAWTFVWPIAFVAARGDARIVRQVVPRSFTRTRLIDLVFGAAMDAAASDAQRAKTGAQDLQTRRAAGDGGPASPAVDGFRERLATALAVAD